MEEVYVNEVKDRSALAEQVRMLTQLNNTLSQDTQNLALALKGDHKAQGDWERLSSTMFLKEQVCYRDSITNVRVASKAKMERHTLFRMWFSIFLANVIWLLIPR